MPKGPAEARTAEQVRGRPRGVVLRRREDFGVHLHPSARVVAGARKPEDCDLAHPVLAGVAISGRLSVRGLALGAGELSGERGASVWCASTGGIPGSVADLVIERIDGTDASCDHHPCVPREASQRFFLI